MSSCVCMRTAERPVSGCSCMRRLAWSGLGSGSGFGLGLGSGLALGLARLGLGLARLWLGLARLGLAQVGLVVVGRVVDDLAWVGLGLGIGSG